MAVQDDMMLWMKDLWDYPRSLSGHGTLKTLQYLQGIHPDLSIHTKKTGEKVFDWEIPLEWNIHDAYLEHESGQRFAEFSKHNLHVVGYSDPCDVELSLEQLLEKIYTQPDMPDAIPYVTSYYNNRWGFCLSENEKQSLPTGLYRAVIKADKGPGQIHFADLVIKGKTSREIFFSTYVCHPSMANNELSGPVVASALAQYIKGNHPNANYTYRFAFLPETIGAVAYLSDHLIEMKDNMACGFVLTCVGDERSYSHVQSRFGNTLADQALSAALIGVDNFKTYSFLDRGSDERQYCSAGVDLPVCTFCRTKFHEYPEYHTSADNFDVVTGKGLSGALNVMTSIVDAFELGLYPKVTVKGEPQLGKRNLYPNISQRGGYRDVKTRMDFLAYADGTLSLFEIARIIGKNVCDVNFEAKTLSEHGLVEFCDALK